MRLISRDSYPITMFGSVGVVVTHAHGRAEPSPRSVVLASIEKGGRIGRHDATLWQVLIVVTGRVRVAGADRDEVHELGPGGAVEWAAGESHETVGVTDAEVLLVEAESERAPGGPNS